ncbi:hypothetical protein B0H14DRAFT_3860373 [Mycena olivaceomarginata]|nr:hypothetical protein B0H14DRAFT_3860373 [Mycena olivaceomarginata]
MYPSPARTCIPCVFPSRSLRPLRSPPVLFHGLEDYDGDVYRPFVFDNNPVVSSDELPVLLWQTRGFRLCLHPYLYPTRVLGTSLPPSAVPPRRPLSSPALARSPPPRTRLRHVPRAGPLPCAPLALVVLLPLHVFCLRCRPEALRRRHRRIRQARPVDHDERAHLPRFSLEHEPAFAATPLSECNGYAGLIRVLLIIPCALSLCMRKRAAFLTLNLKGFATGGRCSTVRYIVRLIGWARKYGIRVSLDLHNVPGSQNGYNHSGRLGMINFFNGPMGFANAQRMLDYIRVIVEFISQPEDKDSIPMFEIVNEAYLPGIGCDVLMSLCVSVVPFLPLTQLRPSPQHDSRHNQVRRKQRSLWTGKAFYAVTTPY